MYCAQCGKEVPNTAKVCGYCGTPLKVHPSQADVPGAKKSKRSKSLLGLMVVGGIVGLIVILVVVVLAGAYINTNRSDPVNQPESISLISSNTRQPTTSYTADNPPDPSPLSETMTPFPDDCNRAKFIKDVTVPDGTYFGPNEGFTKTWLLQNTGSCPWTADYTLVFEGGSDMWTTKVFPFDQEFGPEKIVGVSVQLKSPSTPGEHTSYWNLYNAENEKVTLEGFDAFWVTINVTLEPTPTIEQ